MRLQRLFYCMVAGLAAAATIALILGDSGIVAYRRAAEYRDRLVGGIEEIEAAHRRLQRQLARFQSDAEAVRLAARELGYYRPGETVVSISEGRGRSAVAERGEVFDATYYSVGPLVHERLPRSHGGAKTLPMGFSFGALLFLIVTAADAIRARGQAAEGRRVGRGNRRSDERRPRRRRGVQRQSPLRHEHGDAWGSHIDGRAPRPTTGQPEAEWVARADAAVRPNQRPTEVTRRAGRVDAN